MVKGASLLGVNFGLVIEHFRFCASNQTFSPLLKGMNLCWVQATITCRASSWAAKASFWVAVRFLSLVSIAGIVEFWMTEGETTNELDPLKGLTRLLTLVEVMKEGGRESLGLKSLIQRSYWGNSKRTWLKFSGSNFGLYILLILFVHDCMGSTDTVCIRKTLSPGLWVRKLSRQCIEWKHRHVWCMRHQNGRKEKKA